jgi:hypothetical protein
MTGFADHPEAVPLVAWSPAQVEALRVRIAAVWTRWATQWLPLADSTEVRVTVTPAHEQAGAVDGSWTAIGSQESSCAWLAGEDAAVQVGRLMFGKDPLASPCAQQSTMADAVARQGWSRLGAAIREALGADAGTVSVAPAPRLWLAWSGAVVVRLQAGPERLDLMLDRVAVAAGIAPVAGLSRTRPTLSEAVPVLDAIGSRKLRCRVELAECDIDIGSLTLLRAGDVVQLPHPLSEAVHVKTLEGDRICAAHLGRRGPSKAVELVRDDAATGATLT